MESLQPESLSVSDPAPFAEPDEPSTVTVDQSAETSEDAAPEAAVLDDAAREEAALQAARELVAELRLATEPSDADDASAVDAAKELLAELRTAPDPEAASQGQGAKPPSLGLLLIEGRALGELATTYALMPLLRRGPRGDGHPVLVLPGFLASDVSTAPLRRFLKRHGYATHPWELGRNLGPRKGVEDRLMERLQEVRELHGRRVSLIGWSLGGVYARMLANRSPDDVRCVITLGSPFGGDPKANKVWPLFEWASGQRLDEVDPDTFRQIRETPPVPTTSIYSRSDGVTSWRCCVDEEGPRSENIRVPGSHCGLGANPLVLHAVLDRLAQPQDAWQRFRRSGLKRLFYWRPWGSSLNGVQPAEA